MTAQIALIQGNDRYGNLRQALDLLADRVDLHDCPRILVKPNLVSSKRSQANTHPDAVRAVLDFIFERYDGPVDIAEGAALINTHDSYARFGYIDLARQYPIRLVDCGGFKNDVCDSADSVRAGYRRPAELHDLQP